MPARKLKQHFAKAPSANVAMAELLVASVIWGFGFIAARWALESAGPFWVAALRFLLAFALGIVFVLRSSLKAEAIFSDFRHSAVAGVLLSLALILQTAGLRYTTVANSGFITTLYALMVPALEVVFFKKRLTGRYYFYLLLALVGTVLISRFNPLSGQYNVGDALTLLCALVSSLHMIYLSRISSRIQGAFSFNVFQSFWAGFFAFVCAIFFDPVLHWPFTTNALTGVLFLSIGSTLFAFYLQVRVQKVLSASLASLFFLLESPFAAILAFFLFKEKLSTEQWVGATLILLATLLASSKKLNKSEAR